MRLSDIHVNAHGLTKEEIQNALDSAARFKKEFSEMKWEEIRKKLLLDIIELISREELDFISEIVKFIKEKHPDLLKDV